MKSNLLSVVAEQRELELYRQPEPNSVPIEIIRKKQTSGSAFTLACDSCGKSDAEIYGFVGIDAGTFSKIKKGLATLQGDDLKKFCYAVNNRIYPEWLAYQVDCQLVLMQTEAERRAEAATKRAEEAERRLKWAMDALAGRERDRY